MEQLCCYCFLLPEIAPGGLPWGSVSEEATCSAGDVGSIPGSGRSLEEEMVTHSSILAWRIPWTEEPGGLQSRGLQESDRTEQLTHPQVSSSPGLTGLAPWG